MASDSQERFAQRVKQAAESALARQQYVSAIDVLTGTGLLAHSHVEAWRKGLAAIFTRDARTNKPVLSIPLPESLSKERLTDAISGLANKLGRAFAAAATSET